VILDTSAIIGVLFREDDAARLVAAMERPGCLGVGAPTLAEASVVLTVRRGEAGPQLHRFIQEFGVSVIPFSEPHWGASMRAFERYGRGRHPAKLNFGDCMSYATAKLAKQPLLCKGDDFPQTDLELVPY
jgi:ribonuclease VapC